jgi:hypothetical protein
MFYKKRYVVMLLESAWFQISRQNSTIGVPFSKDTPSREQPFCFKRQADVHFALASARKTIHLKFDINQSPVYPSHLAYCKSGESAIHHEFVYERRRRRNSRNRSGTHTWTA